MLTFIIDILYNNVVYVFWSTDTPEDGYGRWPKHVGMPYISKIVQFAGNELVYVYQFKERCEI